ncbi:MAG: DUF4249 family protein [Bacteroidetes bacterium]|nr:DUF4249 family protein [Bacteroidota bacterium]MDA1336734.1 DUF4249 family protein [Bacteroidota bacterium]
MSRSRVWLIFLVAFLSGCSTEVDLNAPYQRTPVVFGLLDAAQDTQWVRLNRTWLGEGNQFDAALIADSSEFSPDDVVMEVVERQGSNASNNWYLKDTIIENKSEDGIFYAPFHQMWYFVPESGLNSGAEYDLSILIEGEDPVSSTTNMIAEQIGNITQPPPGVNNFKLGFASIGFQTTYPDITFKWASTAGASRYDVTVFIHVTEMVWNDLEHTDLFEEREVLVEWNIGTLNTTDDEGGEVLQKEVSGERFYTTLATKLEANPYITRVLGTWDDQVQIARAIDFVLTIANDELSTYLEVNAPVTGVIQERPAYTNINGGLGLFAARASQGVYGIGFTTASVEHLIEGDATAALNFCSPNPFSEFYCD